MGSCGASVSSVGLSTSSRGAGLDAFSGCSTAADEDRGGGVDESHFCREGRGAEPELLEDFDVPSWASDGAALRVVRITRAPCPDTMRLMSGSGFSALVGRDRCLASPAMIGNLSLSSKSRAVRQPGQKVEAHAGGERRCRRPPYSLVPSLQWQT